jgi:hypothetical protein
MVTHGAEPAFFGMRSGDNDMKSVMMMTVTLHWWEGRHNVMLSAEAQAEGGQQLVATRQDHRHHPHWPCWWQDDGQRLRGMNDLVGGW